MKILFIGGTGRLSKDVASLALKKGNDVFLLTRGSKERTIFVEQGYHMLYGDIRDYEVCSQLLKDMWFDVIIDFLSFTVDHLERTLRTIEGRYKQYIFISSATVYRKNNEDEIISEDLTPIGNDKWTYAANKCKCELFIRQYFTTSKDIYYTIIRPYVTYGNTRVPYPLVPRDNSCEWSFVDRILQGCYVPTIDTDIKPTSLMHTIDFASAVVGLIGNEQAYSEDVHIASDKPTSYESVLTKLGEITGKDVRRLEFSVEEISSYMPEYEEVLKGDKAQTQIFNDAKIKKLSPNFKCSVELSDGLRDMINFYNIHPEMKKIDYKWNGQVDRLIAYKIGKGNSYCLKGVSLKNKFRYFLGYYKAIGDIYSNLGKLVRRLRYVFKR